MKKILTFISLLMLAQVTFAADEPNDFYIVIERNSQMLYVFDDERVVLDMKVVLGKPGNDTPNFNDVTLTHVITNPTWTSPRSITIKELLPRIKKRGWFGSGWELLLNGKPVDPYSVNFKAYGNNFPYTIRQKSGPRNALGFVKFKLKNNGAIFLHDTNKRHLFKRENRFFSHGCVRLEKPIELANLLGVKVVPGKREKWHKLKNPVPVYITEE